MKILSICSNEYPAPPPPNVIHASLYISSVLAEGLAKKGHQVSYVCSKGSTIKTNKIFPLTNPFFDVVEKKDWDDLPDMRVRAQIIVPFEIDLHLKMLEVLRHEKFDIVHMHSTPPFLGLPFALRTNTPNVFTLHGGSTPLELKVTETFNTKNNYFISISNHQRREFPHLPFLKTIYHGIPLEKSKFNEKGGKPMVFTSRLKRVKGVEKTIIVAKKTNKELLMSGDIRGSEKDYFYNTIQPMIRESSNLVTFLNRVDHSTIDSFFGQGKLFLFPIQWEEPFGLVLIEAMATGTPVVAFARGSVPEVIRDGETGFIINPSDDDIRGDFVVKKTGVEGLCEAVEKIYAMPKEEYLQMRKNSRAHVEKNFTVENMVDNYDKVYRSILNI